MLRIIKTNINPVDFQSLIFEVGGLTWKEFKDYVIQNKNYADYVEISSMELGSTTVRCRYIDKIMVDDNFHLLIKYNDKWTTKTGYYLVEEW